MPSRKLRMVYEKIVLVLDTEKDEKIWIVNTLNKSRIKIPVDIIKKYNLRTPSTEFVVESVSCKCREGTNIYRFVKWVGFKERTKEHVDFIKQY